MIRRTSIVIAMLAAAALFGARASGREAQVARESLATLPHVLDDWRGREAAPLRGDVVAQLGVDDYIHRTYVAPERPPVSLYAGYYESQRQGDTIHSPQNCLPGAGWRPVSSSILTIEAGGRQVPVNHYVIQKGLDRQVVLYWYQGRGRVIANEFHNKALLMWDAATLRRTNGGLVRIISPHAETADATPGALAFAKALIPRLERLMP
ncbi:MAG TPA: EpsI family protein [Vicinamibacterales bacterium]|nr:EpsI family protein [Vicinamibacterales bacterium]HVM68742.1 EpsI family protein [Gaiellaceae bacterium]